MFDIKLPFSQPIFQAPTIERKNIAPAPKSVPVPYNPTSREISEILQLRGYDSRLSSIESVINSYFPNGTLSINGAANLVYATPATGAGNASLRKLVLADFPVGITGTDAISLRGVSIDSAAATPSLNNILKYDGTKWALSSIGATSYTNGSFTFPEATAPAGAVGDVIIYGEPALNYGFTDTPFGIKFATLGNLVTGIMGDSRTWRQVYFSKTMANNSTTPLMRDTFLGSGGNIGFMLITDGGNRTAIIILTQGGAPTILNLGSTNITGTLDNAGTINVYAGSMAETNFVIIQNKVGSSLTIKGFGLA